MNVSQLVTRMRSTVLDDSIEPYLWSDQELIDALNDTMDELSEEQLVIVDQTTESITQVRLLSYTVLHEISPYIIQVRSGRLETDKDFLIKTTEDWLDNNIDEWRTTTGTAPTHFAPSAAPGYLSVYPMYDDSGYYQGDSDISFTSATKTVSWTGGDFSGLSAGDEVSISGTSNNDGVKTVVTVNSVSFTVNESVTTESNTSALIKLVRDKLVMSVNRMPNSPFTPSDIDAETSISGLNLLHHPKLLNGMAKRLYLKPDSETYDKGKSEHHRGLFEVDKKRLRRALILLHKPAKAFTVKDGTGTYY